MIPVRGHLPPRPNCWAAGKPPPPIAQINYERQIEQIKTQHMEQMVNIIKSFPPVVNAPTLLQKAMQDRHNGQVTKLHDDIRRLMHAGHVGSDRRDLLRRNVHVLTAANGQLRQTIRVLMQQKDEMFEGLMDEVRKTQRCYRHLMTEIHFSAAGHHGPHGETKP